MGRLVNHRERLAVGWQRRWLLSQWRGPAYASLVALLSLLALDVFGLWLDRVVWCFWIAVCVCYTGTSPLVTTPLQGFVPKYCDGIESGVGLGGGAFLRTLCREASAYTASILLAVALGIFTYPLITAQFRYLLSLLPLPRPLRRVGPALVLAVAVAQAVNNGVDILEEVDLDGTIETGSEATFLAIVVLAANAAISGIEMAVRVRYNRVCLHASDRGRALHFYVAQRVEEVQVLEKTSEWAEHYRLHSPRDTFWRYRCKPVWLQSAICFQACGLLIWAAMIYPHCDVVLAVGAGANLLHVAWWLGASLAYCCRGRAAGAVRQWYEGLEDATSDPDSEAAETQLQTLCEGDGKSDTAAVDGCKEPAACASGEPARDAATAPSPSASGGDGTETAPAAAAPAAVATDESNGVAPSSSARRRRQATPPPPRYRVLEETPDELALRQRIEAMRRAAEVWPWW